MDEDDDDDDDDADDDDMMHDCNSGFCDFAHSCSQRLLWPYSAAA